MKLGTIGGMVSSPPLVGNIISISILLSSSLFFSREDYHQINSDYKYAVRAIALSKMVTSGIIIGYSLRDGDLYHKGEDQKCFKDNLKIPCFDSDKVNNCMLGELLMVDAMTDLSFKISLSDIFLF